jgi:uracil-DNA glycosylase
MTCTDGRQMRSWRRVWPSVAKTTFAALHSARTACKKIAMPEPFPPEPVGWALPKAEAIERANAYLQARDDSGLVADPTMSFRNVVQGLWIVNYMDPGATGEPIDGGSLLVVPNHGDLYEISGLPDEMEWIGVETRGEAAGLPADWSEGLSDELDEPYWSRLMAFVATARDDQAVYPSAHHVFHAFELSPYEATRVVILGQDPYHGPGQAHGLCFSVPDGLPKKPPSLLNILKELRTDVGVELPNGSLEGWARQGVLLLNTTLTVRGGKAGSHRGQGWETFTNAVITALDRKEHRVVFIFWGKDARRKKKLIKNPHHRVIEATHPSPLSAYRGFFGSKPFSTTNALLKAAGLPEIDWSNTSSEEGASGEPMTHAVDSFHRSTPPLPTNVTGIETNSARDS